MEVFFSFVSVFGRGVGGGGTYSENKLTNTHALDIVFT